MCSLKTILKIVLAIAASLLAAYAVFPPLRPLIATFGPYFLFLGCPLAMFAMMTSMQGTSQQAVGKREETKRALPFPASH